MSQEWSKAVSAGWHPIMEVSEGGKKSATRQFFVFSLTAWFTLRQRLSISSHLPELNSRHS